MNSVRSKDYKSDVVISTTAYGWEQVKKAIPLHLMQDDEWQLTRRQCGESQPTYIIAEFFDVEWNSQPLEKFSENLPELVDGESYDFLRIGEGYSDIEVSRDVDMERCPNFPLIRLNRTYEIRGVFEDLESLRC